MGDRVLFQVVGKEGFSPVVYGHWSGCKAPEVLERLQARMKGREGDVQYTAARLVQELVGDAEGGLSFGLWNAKAKLKAKDSHGDAGVVLIHAERDGLRFECLGGYLKVAESGKVVEP
jgi:hypothetical protein